VSFDCAGKAACDPTASPQLRAALVRFCSSVHVNASAANHLDRQWANAVHPAWLITDAMSRFVQDGPLSCLADVSYSTDSPAFVLLSIWTPAVELFCKRVLAHNPRAMTKAIKDILRRFADALCTAGCASKDAFACQNAMTCLSVLRALGLKPQPCIFEAFDHCIDYDAFAQGDATPCITTTDLSASTSGVSALRWKFYITALKPSEEHIDLAIAHHLSQAEPGIHLPSSVSSTIAFNLCLSCRKGGFFFNQHDTWNQVVLGVTRAIESCAAKFVSANKPFSNAGSIKWLSEGVCGIIVDSISMAAVPSHHRFVHSHGGLFLGIQLLHAFKHEGQAMLLHAVSKQPDDCFFAGLIAIVDEAAAAAPRIAVMYNQIVQVLKRELSNRDAIRLHASAGDLKMNSFTDSANLTESLIWERLDQLKTEPNGCTYSQRLALGGLAAKFVQSWCEDHNAPVQDACAGIRPHGSSNPVLSLTNLVLACSRQACPPLQCITSLALEAITESIQRPCKPQQLAVAQTDIVHVCDDLILGRWSDGSDPSVSFSCNCPLAIPEIIRIILKTTYTLPDIRSRSCSLLLALVESLETDSQSESSIPMLMLKAMRFEEHKKFLSLLQQTDAQDVSTCTNLVVVFLTLEPFIPKFGVWAAKLSCIRSILNPEASDDVPIISYVRKCIRCVDVVHKGAVHRIWFPQPELMTFTRSYYLETVQRSIFNPSDHDAQAAAFCSLSLALIEQMLLDQRLSKNVFTKYLSTAVGWVQYLFIINAVIINSILLFAFERQDDASSADSSLFVQLGPDTEFRNLQYLYTLRALSWIQFCFSFCLLCWFMVSDVSFIVRERIRRNAAWMHVYVSRRGGPEHFIIWCTSVISNPRFLTLSSYFIASILSVSLSDRFTPMLFLSLHLADAVYLAKDMKVVIDFISSVWLNLVTIIGFIFILLNIFGAVGFVWIPDWFELPEPNADWYPAVNGTISSGEAVEAPCSTLWRCFLIQVDKGLVLGDIDYGIISTSTSDEPASMMYSRILYSFIFQVIVGILSSFILYTVVIDSFSKVLHNFLATAFLLSPPSSFVLTTTSSTSKLKTSVHACSSSECRTVL
jgi:hypothetical protein